MSHFVVTQAHEEVRPVSLDLMALLTKRMCDEPMLRAEIAELAKFCEELRDGPRNLWVTCPCVSNGLTKERPVLMTRKLGGCYHVFALNSQQHPQHSSNCVAVEEGAVVNYSGGAGDRAKAFFGKPPRRRDSLDCWTSMPAQNVVLGGGNSQDERRYRARDSDSGARTDPILRVLYALLEAAKLDRVSDVGLNNIATGTRVPLDIAEWQRLLRQGAKDVFLANARWPLADMLATTPEAFTEADLAERMLRAPNGATRKMGFVVGLADAVVGHDISFITATGAMPLVVKNKVKLSPCRSGCVAEPFVVIIQLLEDLGCDLDAPWWRPGFVLQNAFAQPIFSLDQPIPVSSSLERETVGVIARATAGTTFSGYLQKPLFSVGKRELGASEEWQPDFLFKRFMRKDVYVECLTMLEERQPGYYAHKLKMQDFFEGYGVPTLFHDLRTAAGRAHSDTTLVAELQALLN